ncbi:hypothetical protein OJ998_09260 [Solirubrobacter taibaiensis]|nr:hypothetical protein [Solirubrobacter taibaiensis]
MRPLLLAALLLVCAAPARADVFVPADPAGPADAHCVDAAGDVVAVTRKVREGWVIEASVGGGPWQRLLGAPVRALYGFCPSVAAAADGTAVIAGGQPIARIAVRRPGGTFGTASALGRTGYDVALAAAPGGWVTAAWTRTGIRSLNSALNALVIAPSGAVTRAVLDRGQGLGGPRVVLGPDGTATVAWNNQVTRRFAEFRGGAWGAPIELEGGSGSRAGDGGLALAATPSGRRLFAWAADDGIRVQADGEPLAVVLPVTDGTAVAGALADDGSAIVTATGLANTTEAADRGPGGAWSVPHTISTGERTTDYTDTPGPPPFSVVVAPGGRAAAAWLAGAQIAAAGGQAGGAWGAATPVSLPTRSAYAFDLSLTGREPRLLFGSPDGGPLRGALLAATAPVDTSAPTFSAQVPRRLPGTKTGRITLPVAVQCEEACDARIEVDSETYAVRALGAGEQTAVRLSTRLDIGRAGDRRVAFRIIAGDRAGNVTRRRASVRVRVLDRPIRSFKVALDHDFGMFSAAGDRAVARFVNDMIDRLARGELKTYRAFRRLYDAGFDRIERAYDEAGDTAVRDAIADALYVPAARAGLDAETLFDG